jgi:hypothetical protein
MVSEDIEDGSFGEGLVKFASCVSMHADMLLSTVKACSKLIEWLTIYYTSHPFRPTKAPT